MDDLDRGLDDATDAGGDLLEDLRAGLEGTGWTATPKDAEPEPAEPAGDADPAAARDEDGDGLRGELRAELRASEAAPAAADADAEWQREHRRLADEALRRAGFDPERRHEHGLSRRSATRALYAAEQRLREDLPEGLGAIARGYRGTPEQARAAVQRVAAELGVDLDGPNGLAAQDRARLQRFEEQARAHHEALQQAAPVVAKRVADFAAAHPEVQKVGREMIALLNAGAAVSLEAALEMAVRARGLPTAAAAQQASALEAAQARRDHAARAESARTPRTASVSGDATTDQPLKDDLRDGLRQIRGGRR